MNADVKIINKNGQNIPVLKVNDKQQAQRNVVIIGLEQGVNGTASICI
jgi:hypothetical protein